MSPNRILKVAAIQPQSRNFDVDGNLQRAQRLVELAAQRGAQLVLCPEFLAAGYIYDRQIWTAAEPPGGPTETWLLKSHAAKRAPPRASPFTPFGPLLPSSPQLIALPPVSRRRRRQLKRISGGLQGGCTHPPCLRGIHTKNKRVSTLQKLRTIQPGQDAPIPVTPTPV